MTSKGLVIIELTEPAIPPARRLAVVGLREREGWSIRHMRKIEKRRG